jgi:hypothetical protein
MCFALLAGTLSLIAFVAYSWKTLTGQNHPNISSWIVWSFLTILNFTSYKKLTGDWVKSILPTANAVMTLITLICAFITGAWRSLSGIDEVCLTIGMTAGILWWILQERKDIAGIVQILLQTAVVIGFIPTFIGTYHSPHSELLFSWLLWTLCFIAQVISVRYTWSGKYLEFLYPVLMIICHGIVFILAMR